MDEFNVINYSTYIFLSNISNKQLMSILFNLTLKGIDFNEYIEKAILANTNVTILQNTNALFTLNKRKLYAYNDLVLINKELRKYYFINQYSIASIVTSCLCLDKDFDNFINALNKNNININVFKRNEVFEFKG